jgi:hypothetical protein
MKHHHHPQIIDKQNITSSHQTNKATENRNHDKNGNKSYQHIKKYFLLSALAKEA